MKLLILLINVEMPTIVGILTFISRINDYIYILNAKKPAPGKDIKIYEKNGNVKV